MKKNSLQNIKGNTANGARSFKNTKIKQFETDVRKEVFKISLDMKSKQDKEMEISIEFRRKGDVENARKHYVKSYAYQIMSEMPEYIINDFYGVLRPKVEDIIKERNILIISLLGMTIAYIFMFIWIMI